MGVHEVKEQLKQPKVTLVSARQLADQPIKLLNHLLRSIKDDAEYGRTQYVFSTNSMSEAGELFITNELTSLGFNVDIQEVTHNAVDVYDNFTTETLFIISW